MPRRPSGTSKAERGRHPGGRSFRLSYPVSGGRRSVTLRLPAGAGLEVAGPGTPARTLDDRRLARALNAGGWDHLAPTLFIVNDAQRSTPTARLLSLIDPPLDRWPAASFIVATGSHAAPGEGDMARIFGRALMGRLQPRIMVHDARARDLAAAGRTRRGTVVRVHPAVFAARRLVAVGSVEPHYFAGYTGGRKAVVPGLAAFETIRQNHRLAMEAGAAPARLRGNPVHLDLEEACRLVLAKARREGLAEALAVSVVNRGEAVSFLERGPLLGAVRRAAAAADRVWVRPVGPACPVVVALAGPPLDRDFYQAMKAFELGQAALAPGGVLILVAACAGGMGPEHFAGMMRAAAAGGRPAPRGELSEHKPARLLGFLRGGRRLYVVAERGLEDLRAIGVPVFPTLAGAVDRAVEEAAGFGDDPRVLCLSEAANLLPRPRS